MSFPSCGCKCGCPWGPAPDCDGLCSACWREWCRASEKHAPIADDSYMGIYGLGNIWTGWIMSQAPHVVAEPPAYLQRHETAPRCPECDWPMVRRVGCWKCYRLAHEETVVVMEDLHLPRSPRLRVIDPSKGGL
ncbi:MAG: hypothetical protein A2Y74_04460 [Actinobacteria bacterium RBG_13_63_9]|nr:MAG: hypothetical protein A2Y74_04460 [Actinobacteria bacterium RBG_13_63_9]